MPRIICFTAVLYIMLLSKTEIAKEKPVQPMNSNGKSTT